jgi:phosphatidate cytidylyltransferase
MSDLTGPLQGAGTTDANSRSGTAARAGKADMHGRDGDQTDPGKRLARPARHKFELAFGLPYIGLAAVALPWLRADPEVGLRNTLFVLSIVWASDIGAYMVGRLVGGPKLAPAISPGKTWSGAAGGLACAVLGGTAVAAWVSPELSALHVIGPGIILGVISQAGDLLESALKRYFGVKDSGRIIPGHGGLLDRLDALLAVAPVAALLAFTVGRGVVLWR